MKIAIEGMHCDACVRRVRMALDRVPGAKVADVRVGSAEVTMEESQRPAVLQAIQDAGYEPHADA